jgi:energy-coupling factor transport system permease protein
MSVPLLISAFRRADELAEAMEARGYHRGPRSALRELRLEGRDFAAMGFMLIVMAVLAISRVYVKP